MSTYWMVTAGMTVSVTLFLTGYAKRRNMVVHRFFMIGGTAANLLTAAFLLVSVYALGDGDFRRAGFLPTVPPWAILAHRPVAMATTVLMLAMVYTGVRRLRSVHVRLHYFFLPLYLTVYTTGFFFFSPS